MNITLIEVEVCLGNCFSSLLRLHSSFAAFSLQSNVKEFSTQNHGEHFVFPAIVEHISVQYDVLLHDKI